MNYSALGGGVDGGLRPDYPQKNPSESRRLIGTNAVLIALSTIFVVLRLVSRKLSKASFWWDDAFILLALILSYGLPIANVARIHYGHDEQPYTPDELVKWLKNIYVFQLFYVISVSVVKFSILLFYQRIFPLPQFKTPLLSTHLVVIVFMVCCFFVSVFQCTPVSLYWLRLGPLISQKPSPVPIQGKCIDIVKMLISTGAINAVLDFFVLVLPIPILWRLKASKLRITILTGIFTIATFACVMSVIRLIVLSHIKAGDNASIHTDIPVWTATEVSMAIVSACIPSLRPLVTFLRRSSCRSKPKISPGTQLSAATTSSTSTVYPPYNNNNNNNNDNENSNIKNKKDVDDDHHHHYNNPICSHLHPKPEKGGGGDFIRLNSEAGGNVLSAWGHEVTVHASGRKKEGGPGGVGGGGEKDGDDIEMLAPGGIRVKTEITLTREKRIEYLDRLY